MPGATVTATQNGQTVSTITDAQGAYRFPDMADGNWAVEIQMPGFAPLSYRLFLGERGPDDEDVGVVSRASSPEWELKMLPLDEIHAQAAPAGAQAASPGTATTQAPANAGKKRRGKKAGPVGPTNTAAPFQRADLNAATSNANAAPAQSETAQPANEAPGAVSEMSQRAADGFLINGTTNNGASSPFAQAQAFGNSRRGRSLYNGNIGVLLDNSALDARPFSLNGQNTARPNFNNVTGVLALGGPLKIPYLLPNNGPNFFVNYQWTRNRNVATQPGLMPDAAERAGDFSQALTQLNQPAQIMDPTTGQPFPGNVIPQSRISPQARALLAFYPQPNFIGQYNYQIPLVSNTHQDSLQSRINKTIGRKNQVSGLFAMQSTRSDNPNTFGFLDTNRMLGFNAMANWRHNFTPRFFMNLGYRYTRQDLRLNPFFANRENVSSAAGVTGNNQDPVNWGPPTLIFASGISSLTDGLPSFTRNQTSGVSADNLWTHGRHNVSFGGGFTRQELNLLGQQDPRGTFTFTGAATGGVGGFGPPYDFADFLLGVPDTSSIAFGNADKYFRSSIYNAYVTDDWRIGPGITVNAGLRWEYWSPINELYGRLVNLDIAQGFTAEAPVLASNPIGTLTGQKYPSSLLQPDKHAFQPRIGMSWRPFPASSMVIRAGYGIYYNTSVYQYIATQMAQQAPLSKSLLVPNSPSDPLTLANGFNASPTVTPNTFAVDPNLRIGYLQDWQVSVQRDLPGSMVLIASYLGSKGTRAMQEFYPNTYPTGAVNPCPACPSGFVYLASNGNSTYEAGQVQLRRRLHNGFTANVQYTFSKAIDDAALGGSPQSGAPTGQGQSGQGASGSAALAPMNAVIAQNWLDLSAERGLSPFNQEHQVSFQIQYTTGMGVGGGTLLNGWKGALFKQWTFMSMITAATGLPETPLYPFAANGTGNTSQIRPNYTGAPLYSAPPGAFLNPAAYVPPVPGQWGNAGRNSITGPAQFLLNASMGRTFQVSDRMSLDFQLQATNALNHVTFTNWVPAITSLQFGLPGAVNGMRTVQTSLRLRF